ncbi:peptide chain release factor N(5)-glutamine methyltransferase [Candidatus Peregrinibacteria bacterium]|nr:MAG: peptide chain release factor N(5)-glutamine methyltransferase [Candidatus Peregrinibacteria bacterium]
MTIKTLLNQSAAALEPYSGTPRLDVEILLAHALKRPLAFLLSHNEQKISSIIRWRFERWIEKRKRGVPIAYLIGHKEFYCLDFKVNSHTLIPRPDTEILVETAIDFIQNMHAKTLPLLVDVGTGSGCIPIAILNSIPQLKAVATDISGAALRVASQNAKAHRVLDRMTFLKSDLLAGFHSATVGDRAWVVTANLPYIPLGFPMTAETTFEPPLALFAEDEGLFLYKKLVQQIIPLKPLAIFFECFDFQVQALCSCLPGYRMQMTPMSGQACVAAFYRL